MVNISIAANTGSVFGRVLAWIFIIGLIIGTILVMTSAHKHKVTGYDREKRVANLIMLAPLLLYILFEICVAIVLILAPSPASALSMMDVINNSTSTQQSTVSLAGPNIGIIPRAILLLVELATMIAVPALCWRIGYRKYIAIGNHSKNKQRSDSEHSQP